MNYNFLNPNDHEDERPVEFKRIDIKYNYNLGSNDSINLHEALSETSNIDIYKTEAIQKIIEYKWDRLRLWFGFQAFI